MRSQVAIEYLMIVAVVVSAAITFFYYSNSYSSESINVLKAREVVDTLANAVDYVYALGPGSHTTVVIDVPSSVIDSYVTQNEIGLYVAADDRRIEVYKVTKSRVSGTLPISAGSHVLIVNNTATGVVIGPPKV